MLNIEKSSEEKTVVLALQGRLDTTTAPELEAVVKEVLPDLTELILDFEALEYISSAGLRVLLSTEKALNGKGVMKIRKANETILEIFEVTGFSEILTVE